jgi:DNA-binding NarL/FixJ family response regulator
MAELIRVSIVEDDPQMRTSIQSVLKTDKAFVCVSAFSNPAEALQQLPADRPDVVLMDINMKEMDGIACTRQLKVLLPGVHVLMLTVFEDADKIFGALTAGANGYLLKRFAAVHLLDSIRQVIDGGAPMSAPIARKVVNHFQQQPKASAPEATRLAAREREVLDGLAMGHPYKQIADELGVSIATVRTYIGRIYEKLHVHSRTEAVAKYVREN